MIGESLIKAKKGMKEFHEFRGVENLVFLNKVDTIQKISFYSQ